MNLKIYRLDQTVLSIVNNAAQFLNGLTSNTVDRPHNAFLDVHGKIIATFDQLKIAADQYLIVLQSSFVDALLKHIERFVKLSKVVVKREDYKVYFDLNGKQAANAGEFCIPQKAGQIVLSKTDIKSTVSNEEFILFRLQNNIPVHGQDYQNEMLLNVSEQDYVSFTKGCFLGQELVSKVHNRSKPSWKLIVKYEDDSSQPERQSMTSKIIDPNTQRVFGFAFVKND